MIEFGLIGHPLGHSFSKTYFLQKFQTENLPYHFELFPIESIDALPALIHSRPELRGLAVTIPYKQSVLRFLNDIDPQASEIGAVNCIRFDKDDSLKGFNTDIIGFRKSFEASLTPKHQRALILGTGGSSLAVQFALRQLNIPFKLVSRKKNSASQDTILYEEIDASAMAQYKIIINCTPVGMYPKTELKPALPYDAVTNDHYFFDLIYKPEKTGFLQEAEQRGATIKNGFEMLVLQAEENWNIWESTLNNI